MAKNWLSYCLSCLGTALWCVVGIHSSACAFFLQTPSLIDSLEQTLARKDINDSVRLSVLLNLSYRFGNRSPFRAEEYARRALALGQRLQQPHAVAHAYRHLGTSFFARSLYSQALVLYDSSLQMAQRLNDTQAISAVWTNMGLVFEEQGDYPQALEYALRALRLDEALGKKEDIAISLLNIGTLYYRQRQYSEALVFYERAQQIFSALRLDESLAETMLGVGRVHKDKKQYAEALRQFEAALPLAQHYNNQWLVAELNHELATVYLFQRDTKQALPCLQEALRIRQQRQDRKGLAATLSVFGSFYLLKQELHRAAQYYQESLRFADSLGLKDLQMKASYHLSEIYKEQGRYKLALEYRDKGYAYKDSLFNADRSREIGHIEMGYQVEKKEAENQLLVRERELQQVKQSRERLVLSAVSGLLLCCIGVMALLWRFNNRQRAVNQMLQHQQNLVQEQAHEIELINTELQERNARLEDANNELLLTYSQIQEQAAHLQSKNSMLEMLDNEKNEFLGIVTHDLKSPITSIMLSAEMGMAYYDKMPEKDRKEVLRKIHLSAGRMFSIVTNLLDINAIETGNLRFAHTRIPIVRFVQELVSEYQERAHAKNLLLQYEVDALAATEPELVLVSDRHFVGEILDNLLSNAVKYSPQGKRIVVRVARRENCVRCEVRDEGPGLSDEDKKRLFGKFARLSARPTGGEHSTGLGLSIVKKVVEAMHGRVWCESEVGKGATFIVELPLLPQETSSQESSQKLQESGATQESV
jgi:signal transduction histidine kinase